MNGIDTATKTHDFFNRTGSYVVSVEAVPTTETDFDDLENLLGFKIN